jgi:hypothetical protein
MVHCRSIRAGPPVACNQNKAGLAHNKQKRRNCAIHHPGGHGRRQKISPQMLLRTLKGRCSSGNIAESRKLSILEYNKPFKDGFI